MGEGGELVNHIREVRAQLEEITIKAAQPDSKATNGAAAKTAPDPEPLRAELGKLNTELETMQGETPLMRVCVDAQIIGEVVSGWTGIPVGKMLKDELATVLALDRTSGRASSDNLTRCTR